MFKTRRAAETNLFFSIQELAQLESNPWPLGCKPTLLLPLYCTLLGFKAVRYKSLSEWTVRPPAQFQPHVLLSLFHTHSLILSLSLFLSLSLSRLPVRECYFKFWYKSALKEDSSVVQQKQKHGIVIFVTPANLLVHQLQLISRSRSKSTRDDWSKLNDLEILSKAQCIRIRLLKPWQSPLTSVKLLKHRKCAFSNQM